MTAILNGRPRKQLADQIDRLDLILDTLADGFQEIVARAAEDGARIAAARGIQELLQHPTLLALLAQSAPTPIAVEPMHPPGAVDRLPQRLRQLRRGISTVIQPVLQALAAKKHYLQQVWQSALFTLQLAWACRWGTMTAGLVGTSAALLTFFGSTSLAAILCGLSTASVTLAGFTLVPILLALRRVEC